MSVALRVVWSFDLLIAFFILPPAVDPHSNSCVAWVLNRQCCGTHTAL